MAKVEKVQDRNKFKKVKVQEEWIEMEDLHAPKNQSMNKKFAEMQGKQYIPPDVNPQEINYPDISLFSDKLHSQPQPLRNISHNHHPTDISKKKTPSLPFMEVTCDHCTVSQRVPGNTQVFCCGSCQNMNQCFPLYGIAICGNCQSKVGFGFGTAEFIKCPKCSSINRVPLEPKKQYRSVSILNSENFGQNIVQNRRQDYPSMQRHPGLEVGQYDQQYVFDAQRRF